MASQVIDTNTCERLTYPEENRSAQPSEKNETNSPGIDDISKTIQNDEYSSPNEQPTQATAGFDHQQPLARVEAVTSTSSPSRQQNQYEKHIMISYKHGAATAICKKIAEHLSIAGHRIWFDEKQVHGSVLDSMGDGVDDAFVVILCLSNAYSQSQFTMMASLNNYIEEYQAKYAAVKKVFCVPCLMEEGFEAKGSLGLIKSDRKHFEFYDETKFEENFRELLAEIKYLKQKWETETVNVQNEIEENNIPTTHIETEEDKIASEAEDSSTDVSFSAEDENESTKENNFNQNVSSSESLISAKILRESQSLSPNSREENPRNRRSDSTNIRTKSVEKRAKVLVDRETQTIQKVSVSTMTNAVRTQFHNSATSERQREQSQTVAFLLFIQSMFFILIFFIYAMYNATINLNRVS